jgi:hypothetical protein
VGHGMILIAGQESANLFDGKSWRSVFKDLLGVAGLLVFVVVQVRKNTVFSEPRCGPLDWLLVTNVKDKDLTPERLDTQSFLLLNMHRLS